MVKANKLREIAHFHGLKVSHTAILGIDRIAEQAVHIACEIAKQKNEPKLAMNHFIGLRVEQLRQKKGGKKR